MEAARACIGVRFGPQGRDPDFGLDCVGLAAVALKAGGFAGLVPAGYAMRSGDAARVAAAVDAAGLVRVADAGAGDLLLFASGPGQLHLAIGTGEGIVHADAGLGRVVERPGVVDWPVIGIWRLE